MTTDGAPSARGEPGVWTGSEMILWGGESTACPMRCNDGYRYDPALDLWTPTSVEGAPEGRGAHTAVWTGSLMLIWGGHTGTGLALAGGRYDPDADAWTPMATAGAPSLRAFHAAVWTGSEMLVWGGNGDPYRTGGRYDPVTDTWSPMSCDNAPLSFVAAVDAQVTAVWTGSEMVVWPRLDHHYEYEKPLLLGDRYDPASDTWTPTSAACELAARQYHTGVWTGSEMIVWGGDAGNQAVATGARYQP